MSTTAVPGSAGWAPLLTGGAADEALAVVREIADALRGWAAAEDPRHDSPTLSKGLAGVAVFFAEAAELLGDEARATSLALCDRTIDAAAAWPLDPALYGGTVGAGWALSVVERLLEDPDDGE